MPTGTVTLSDFAGNPLTAPASLSNGNASIVVPWYGAGQGMVYASYAGDANYGALASQTVITLVKPAIPVVTLTPAAVLVKPDSTTTLTVLLSGGPSNPQIATPGFESGPVEYWDSVDGAAPQLLAGGPQLLTIGNGNSSINILPVVLPRGVNVITAKFLGTVDWMARNSNPVTVRVANDEGKKQP